MRLWRLTRAPFVALDGAGAELHGARYASPGRPLVSFASEAGLAVLVAMRYLPEERADWPRDFRLGWADIDSEPERIPAFENESEIRDWVDEWLESRRSLVASIPSKVLPEGDIVLFNPAHPDARFVGTLTHRAFSFDDCLHRPPMLDTYRSDT